MTLKELENIEYSRNYGYFIKGFDHNDKHYEAKLIPYPIKNAQCIIRHITDKEDINNITAPEDAYTVFYRGGLPFKVESIRQCIKEFCKDY